MLLRWIFYQAWLVYELSDFTMFLTYCNQFVIFDDIINFKTVENGIIFPKSYCNIVKPYAYTYTFGTIQISTYWLRTKGLLRIWRSMSNEQEQCYSFKQHCSGNYILSDFWVEILLISNQLFPYSRPESRRPFPEFPLTLVIVL